MSIQQETDTAFNMLHRRAHCLHCLWSWQSDAGTMSRVMPIPCWFDSTQSTSTTHLRLCNDKGAQAVVSNSPGHCQHSHHPDAIPEQNLATSGFYTCLQRNNRLSANSCLLRLCMWTTKYVNSMRKWAIGQRLATTNLLDQAVTFNLQCSSQQDTAGNAFLQVAIVGGKFSSLHAHFTPVLTPFAKHQTTNIRIHKQQHVMYDE